MVIIEVEGDVDVGEKRFECVEHLCFGGDSCGECIREGHAVGSDSEVAAGLVIEGVGREVDGVGFGGVPCFQLFNEGEHGIERSTVAVLDYQVEEPAIGEGHAVVITEPNIDVRSSHFGYPFFWGARCPRFELL